MNHHTALKLVPLHSACLKTSGFVEFSPLNTKESDFYPKMFCSVVFLHIAYAPSYQANELRSIGPVFVFEGGMLVNAFSFSGWGCTPFLEITSPKNGTYVHLKWHLIFIEF